MDDKTATIIESVIGSFVLFLGALGMKDLLKNALAGFTKGKQEQLKASIKVSEEDHAATLAGEKTAHDTLLQIQKQDRDDNRLMRQENTNLTAQLTVAMSQLHDATAENGQIRLDLQRTSDGEIRSAGLIVDMQNKLNIVNVAYTELASRYAALENKFDAATKTNTGMADQIATLTAQNLTLTTAATASQATITTLQDKVATLENRISQLMDVLKRKEPTATAPA